MALIGNIEPFSGVAEEFEVYLERMKHLSRVNCVEDSLRVSMFVTLAGSKVYQTLKNLVAPRKPSDLTYIQITGLLRKHYSPPVSEICESFIFNKCNQKPDQSIADYIVELRKLASSCHFGQFLDDALRDRFVCLIRSEQLQADKLSFKTACQKAQAAELAEKQVKDLASSTDNPINAVQRYPEKKYMKVDDQVMYKHLNSLRKNICNEQQLETVGLRSPCVDKTRSINLFCNPNMTPEPSSSHVASPALAESVIQR
nr:unnamed protein product [Callosobruchus analis]